MQFTSGFGFLYFLLFANPAAAQNCSTGEYFDVLVGSCMPIRCNPGEYLDGNDCKPRSKKGEPCAKWNACFSPYVCGPSGTCEEERATVGWVCKGDDKCYSKACVKGQCRAVGGGGSTICGSTLDCDKGLVCRYSAEIVWRDDVRTCQPPLLNRMGEDCESNKNCGNGAGSCAAGFCGYTPERASNGKSFDGFACRDDDNCWYGYCNIETHNDGKLNITYCRKPRDKLTGEQQAAHKAELTRLRESWPKPGLPTTEGPLQAVQRVVCGGNVDGIFQDPYQPALRVLLPTWLLLKSVLCPVLEKLAGGAH